MIVLMGRRRENVEDSVGVGVVHVMLGPRPTDVYLLAGEALTELLFRRAIVRGWLL